MKIKIYVCVNEDKAVSEKDFEPILNEISQFEASNEDLFSEWLCENYSSIEIFDMTSEKKSEILKKWFEECKTGVLADLSYWGWEEYEVEI